MTMKTALQDAGVKRYSPTMHALNRARLRFGVADADVSDWINRKMEDARYVGKSPDNIHANIYESIDSIRLVIDERTNAVITILGDISTDFLRPMLERELRRLKRLYTPIIRKLELEYAEELRNLSDMAINRARARNPRTREVIAERMTDKQAEISDLLTEIERKQDEWDSKVRAIEVISE